MKENASKIDFKYGRTKTLMWKESLILPFEGEKCWFAEKGAEQIYPGNVESQGKERKWKGWNNVTVSREGMRRKEKPGLPNADLPCNATPSGRAPWTPCLPTPPHIILFNQGLLVLTLKVPVPGKPLGEGWSAPLLSPPLHSCSTMLQL